MFTVKCDGKWLYNPELNYQLREPTLTLADNSAGSFEFVIEKSHPLYDEIHEITSRIYVYRDGQQLWEGRPIKETDDWRASRKITCEGALAYLNDTIQEQAEYHPDSYTVETWLKKLIDNHNNKVDISRRFKLGTVTVEETLYRYTNYETTLSAINDKLLSRLGGHMYVRRGSDGYNYIDYLKDYPYSSTQKIEFGRNLLDYSKNYDLTDIATAIIPLGERLEESPIEALEAYTTVETAKADSMHNSKSLYVQNNVAVSNFGWICKVVHWDDVSEPSNLLAKAEKYLNDFQYNELTLQVKALDFHMVDSAVESLKLLDQVEVVSVPHGLDKLFPITKMDIPLANPANMSLTLGTTSTISSSLTSKSNSANSTILKKIEEMPPSESVILKHAKEMATDLIVSGALGSYVIIHPDEIIVTNNLNYTAKTAHVWRWNKNGLGYSFTGYNGTFGLAMTANGAIVADMITTGHMKADRIEGGVLSLGRQFNTGGELKIYDDSNSLIGQWNKDGINIKRGSIDGPSVKLGGSNNVSGSLSIYNASNQLIGSWDKDGLIAKSGGKLTSKDGKVYFDMDNSVLCANKMMSAAADSNRNITVEFGTTNHPTDISNYQGFRIYRTIDPDSGLYLLPSYRGSYITSKGDLAIYSAENAEVSIRGAKFSLYADSPTSSQKFAQISSDTENRLIQIHENLRVSGNINYSGSLGSSDARLKKNVKDLSSSIIEALCRIKIRQFTWKTDLKNTLHVGVLAQDIEKEFDVSGIKNTGIYKIDNEGMYSVDYTAFLLARIAGLEKEINEIKHKLEAL